MEVGVAIGIAVMVLGFIALIIFGIIFWIRMIIDCAKREFKNPDEKLIWLLVVILVQLLGAVIYWAVVVKKSSSSGASTQ